MEHCKFCGAELPEGASFCPYCARSQLEKHPLCPPAPKRRRRLGGWLAGLLAAGLLLCAIGGMLLKPWRQTSDAELRQVEAVQTEPLQTEMLQPEPEPMEETTAPAETTVPAEATAPAETEASKETTAPTTEQPAARIRQETGVRGEFRTQYNTGSNGYVEYVEFYPNGKWAYHLVSSDGKNADIGVYDAEGNILERAKTWDVAGAIAARRESTE